MSACMYRYVYICVCVCVFFFFFSYFDFGKKKKKKEKKPNRKKTTKEEKETSDLASSIFSLSSAKAASVLGVNTDPRRTMERKSAPNLVRVPPYEYLHVVNIL